MAGDRYSMIACKVSAGRCAGGYMFVRLLAVICVLHGEQVPLAAATHAGSICPEVQGKTEKDDPATS